MLDAVSWQCLRLVVNSRRRSVQFFIISKKYMEIGKRINTDADRGVTVVDASGFYSGQEVKMLFVLAKQRQSQTIFRLIEEIDPHAFVSQSAVIGVYGEGFDQTKYKAKKKEEWQDSLPLHVTRVSQKQIGGDFFITFSIVSSNFSHALLQFFVLQQKYRY